MFEPVDKAGNQLQPGDNVFAAISGELILTQVAAVLVDLEEGVSYEVVIPAGYRNKGNNTLPWWYPKVTGILEMKPCSLVKAVKVG